jgi:hypothetical protein
MSKDTSSPELLGTIKFVFDKTKSRTLNATQAYDASTSQIVLASYPATSTINTPTKGLGYVAHADYLGAVTVTGTEYATNVNSTLQAVRAGLTASSPGSAAKTITIFGECSWVPLKQVGAAKIRAAASVDSVQFAGTLVDVDGIAPDGIEPDDPGTTKTKKTKEIFAGNIIVGTGLYRTWQNKYAVLKVDLLTNKAILRVYNE